MRDQKKLKEYQKEWYRRKKAGLPTQFRPTKKMTPEEKKEKKYETRIKYKNKRRELKKKLCGNTCYFCGFERRISGHRKDGKEHKYWNWMGIKEIEREYGSGKYIGICEKCHKSVHWCMNHLGMSWEDIESLYCRNGEIARSNRVASTKHTQTQRSPTR